MKKRNRKPVHPPTVNWRHCLKLEDLEARRLLAGDVLGPGNPAFRNEVEADVRLTEVEDADAPRSERIPNNTIETAEAIPLGFAGGESAAIDIRGELIEPNSITSGNSSEVNIQGVPRLEDGSILLANRVNFSDGVPIQFTGAFDDSVLGFNQADPNLTGGDGDFYELRDVEVGQVISGSVSGASTVLILYDAFGDVLATSDSPNPTQNNTNFISYEVTEEDDYYFAVVPFAGDSEAFNLPRNPFDPASIYGGPNGAYTFTVGVNSQDVDYYSFDLEPGDILGVNAIGAANLLSFYDSSGDLVMLSGENTGEFYPAKSPLPRGGSADFARVIDTPGTYFLGINGFSFGRYLLETRLFRPEVESAPAGTAQILFLDFDGASLNPELFDSSFVPDLRQVSGLSRYVSRFGLNAGDESALIDRIIATVNENFNRDLRRINPNMKLIIRNSRDHADPFGQPNVSRIIVGGSSGETTINTLGIAESIDIGNFDMEETGIVMLDGLSGPRTSPDSLNHYSVARGASRLDFVGQAIGNIVSHEAGHFFGGQHVESNNFVPAIMNLANNAEDFGVGDDLIFGTQDDIDSDFAVDQFDSNLGPVGFQNMPGMLANVLVVSQGGAGITGSTTYTGTIYNDINGNGVREDGENGVEGVRVFVDVNGDNQFGIDEPSGVSNAAGRYRIPNISLTGADVLVAAAAGDRITTPDAGRVSVTPATRLSGTFDFGVQMSGGTSSGIDFGDAPASYGVASHPIVQGLSLGGFVDGEAASTDNDGSDDDGITLSALTPGATATGTAIATNDSQSAGVLTGWIDFNGDGRFAGTERVAVNVLLNDTATFTFTVPDDAQPGTTFARFRYGYERGIGPTGAAIAGEVEDYAVVIADLGGGNGGGVSVTAVNDAAAATQGDTNVAIDVLSNDSGDGALTIVSVGAPSQGGAVSIAGGGASLVYTPADTFFGTETFTYVVSDGSTTDTGLVSVTVDEAVGGTFDVIRFRLETVDGDGNVVSSVAEGDTFTLNVYAQDLRLSGIGVFAAYLDVEFDAAQVAPAGDVTFGESYPAGQVPTGGVINGVNGLFDEYGAFAGATNQLGNDELLLYSVPMVATAVGDATFSSNPADILPSHEVLLGDLDQAIPPQNIDFTSTSLTITPSTVAFTNARNALDVNDDGFVTPRDALMGINEINQHGARRLEGTDLFSSSALLDVNGDQFISSIDILMIINYINDEIANSSDGVAVAAAVDAALDADDEDDLFGAL